MEATAHFGYYKLLPKASNVLILCGVVVAFFL